MSKTLFFAASLTLALAAPAYSEEPAGNVDLGLPSSAGGTGLGIGADLKGRAPVTPPEASGLVSGGSQAAGTITHSDGVSASMQNDAKASVGVGASSDAAGGTTSGVEASIRGNASGSID